MINNTSKENKENEWLVNTTTLINEKAVVSYDDIQQMSNNEAFLKNVVKEKALH